MIAAPPLPRQAGVPVQRARNGWAAIAFAALAALIVGGAAGWMYERASARANAPVVYFVPGESPTNALVAALNGARRSVHMQAYSFTSAPIAKALVDAARRGVDVIAVLDKSNKTANYSSADFLVHEGVFTFIDSSHAIAHNKIIVIDGETVITGSFNFTKAAQESNAENLLVLRDRALAVKYEANFQKHLAHSQPYGGR